MKHLQALLNIQTNFEIDCIVACDTNPSVLNSIQLTGIERHQHPETLVETFQLNAVIVATPDDSHYELGKQFLSQGVDVFGEKPLATTFDHASSLVSLGSTLPRESIAREFRCICRWSFELQRRTLFYIHQAMFCRRISSRCFRKLLD